MRAFRRNLPRVLSLPLFVLSFVCLVPQVREAALREYGGFVAQAFPGSESVKFTSSAADGPLRWESCSVVDVLVNPGSFGATAFAEIESAFSELSTITGLRFRLSPSGEVPTSRWGLSRPGEIPPVLVAWVDPADTDLIDSASGATVANSSVRAGVRRIVTGAVALNAEHYDKYRSGSGEGMTRRNLILHELGHLVGLDHVDGPVLMDPVIDESTPDGFVPVEVGALEGLRSGC